MHINMIHNKPIHQNAGGNAKRHATAGHGSARNSTAADTIVTYTAMDRTATEHFTAAMPRIPGIVLPVLRIALFAGLLWLSAAAGAIHIPGTPVPITLQTFVLMLAALTLRWRESGAAVLLYLLAGAAGLPVFASGASTLALLGPSAGFLIGFLPGVVIASMLKGTSRTHQAISELNGRQPIRFAATVLRYAMACMVGCVLVVYAIGIAVQSSITGIPVATVAQASLGFVIGDLIKAGVAAVAVCTLDGLQRAR